MTLQGKGFFIWKIYDCERGDAEAIASAAKSAGMTHVLIKIANGIYPSNLDSKTKADLVPAVVDALRRRGIEAWGWHYVYGYDPVGEAKIAIQRVKQFNLDGYVIDAEHEYKEPGKAAAAKRYVAELRRALPNTPLALSSYRFPSFHPQLPWREFLDACDYNMPQVYWEQAHNPGAQLTRVVREFQGMTPARPVVPTGPSYKWNGWRPTEADIREFLDTVRKLNLPAVNFFSWDECRRDLNNLWELIARDPFGAPPQSPKPDPPTPPAPKKDITEQYIQALNSRLPEAIAELYRPNAVHINAFRTIQGTQAIRAWHEAFLTEQMPGGAFSLTGKFGIGNSRHFTWTGTSSRGAIRNGSDTFGLIDGKIAFHYTSYAIMK